MGNDEKYGQCLKRKVRLDEVAVVVAVVVVASDASCSHILGKQSSPVVMVDECVGACQFKDLSHPHPPPHPHPGVYPMRSVDAG